MLAHSLKRGLTYLFQKDQTNHELEGQQFQQRLLFLDIIFGILVESDDGIDSERNGKIGENFDLGWLLVCRGLAAIILSAPTQIWPNRGESEPRQ
jgi:hypothetical protein